MEYSDDKGIRERQIRIGYRWHFDVSCWVRQVAWYQTDDHRKITRRALDRYRATSTILKVMG
jgi:hypothetical protein